MKHVSKVAAVFAAVLTAASAQALSITPVDHAQALVAAILGPGITVVGTPSYTGTDTQSGVFTDGNASGVGFEAGMVMTTGKVADVPGPNNAYEETLSTWGGDPDISTDLETLGDAGLSALAEYDTFDAAILAFDFQFGDGSVGGNLFFRFVFASEEYIDYVGSEFNDVFGFYVDGINIALVPGTTTPIAVNTVNSEVNADYYRNNVPNASGIPNLALDLSFDGLTTAITAAASGLDAGTHTMKFAIADTSDGWWDAGVFIEAGTFSTERPPELPAVPEPGSLLLLGSGLVGLAGHARRRTPHLHVKRL